MSSPTASESTPDTPTRRERLIAYIVAPATGGLIGGAITGGAWWGAGIGGLCGGEVCRRSMWGVSE